MERIKDDIRHSQVQELTKDLSSQALTGLIRSLAIILNEREAVNECPLCTWDVEGMEEKLREQITGLGK